MSRHSLINNILVAYDGSDYSFKALDYACRLALALNARVRIVYVIDASRARVVLGGILLIREEELLEKARNILSIALEKIRKNYGGDIVIDMKIRIGHPVEEIINESREWGADILVVGAKGAGGFKEMIIGSVAESIVKYSSKPVLVVK